MNKNAREKEMGQVEGRKGLRMERATEERE